MAELLSERDEDRAIFNAAKHGVSFETAMQAFYVDGVVVEDQRCNYREQRFNRFAVVAGFPICVTYTLWGEVVRLVSARKQNRKERYMAIIRRRAPSTYMMSVEERQRLALMTDDEVLSASQSDTNGLPLTDLEIERLRAARVAQAARRRAGLSQARFAKAYRIKVARLRDLEQGRRQPDPVLVSLLTLIGDDPERAARLLADG